MRTIGASKFIDSIYVGLHVQMDGINGDANSIISMMDYLGVHNFRDSPATAGMANAVSVQTKLAEHGYGGMYIVGGNFGSDYLTEQMQAVERLAFSVRYIEGPNEPNFYDEVRASDGSLIYYQYDGKSGTEAVHEQQADIYDWAHERLPGISVAATSAPGWMEWHPDKWNEPNADLANLHVYSIPHFVNGHEQTEMAFAIDSNVRYGAPYAINSGGRFIVSETGGNNSPSNNVSYSSDETQAKTVLKSVFGNLAAGAEAVAIHDLVDGPAGADTGWGLFREDGSAKFSGAALAQSLRLISGSSDGGSPAEGSGFDFSVQNAPNSYTLGIQTNNREMVAVWGDDGDTRNVSVTFDKLVGWINVHDTLGGGSAYLNFGSTASFQTIYDRPFIFEMVVPTDAYRIVQSFYKGALNAIGDGNGVVHHVSHIVANGWSKGQVANDFINAMPTMDDLTFVQTLYHNSLERNAQSEESGWWLDRMHEGLSRADVLVGIANSPESFSHMQYVRTAAETDTLIG